MTIVLGVGLLDRLGDFVRRVGGFGGEVCTIWAIAGACVDLRLVGAGDGGFVVDVDDGFGGCGGG